MQNKLIAFLLACVVAVSLPLQTLAANDIPIDPLHQMYVGEPINLGHPISSTQFINCTFGVEDGKNMVYTSATGKPAKFICYNLDDRRIEREFTLTDAKSIWSHGTDSKGNVYIGTQSAASLFKYNPVDKSFKNLGQIYDSKGELQTALYNVSFDKEDNPILGTYPSAMLVKYNTKADQFETISEGFIPGSKYIKSQIVIGDYAYCGGNQENAPFFKVNIYTGVAEKLPEFTLTNQTGEVLTVGAYAGFTVAEDLIFANLSMSDKSSIMVVYDTVANEWLSGEDQIIETNGFYASPILDGKVYVHKRVENLLYAFDLTTRKYTKTNLTGSTNRTSKFIEFGTEALPGKTLVTVQSNGSITYNNFETGVYEDVFSGKEGEPIEIRSMEPGYKGTNQIYLGAYMGPRLTMMDLNTRAYTTTSMSQIEGMGQAHGKYYFGVYPGAKIYEYDPTKPLLQSKNPIQIFNLSAEHGQDRPFNIIEAGEYVAISCIPDYGKLQGKLTLYNPLTKDMEVFNAPENQSFVGLAYDAKTNRIYGSTTVWGGLGIDPPEGKRKARIAYFDLTTKQLVTSKEIDLINCATDVMHIGEISFANDGSLWAVAKGIVFEVDKETLEVKREIKIADTTYDVRYMRASPYSIEWVADNVMITNAGGKITAVNITTNKIKVLAASDVSYMTVGEDGNIYYASSNRVSLYMLPFGIDGTIPDNIPKVPKYEAIAYPSFGFNGTDFVTESTRNSGTTELKKLTFAGISNNPSKTGSVEFAVGGTYTGKDKVTYDYSTYKQNYSLSNKDGKNTIKVNIPQKGFQTILQMPTLDFNAKYTANDSYKFNMDVFSTPFTVVESANDISLDSSNPKCFGADGMGLYIRFYDSDGKTISDTSRKYITSSNEWQKISIDMPAGTIPLNAAYMSAIIYCSSGNVTYETHIANPHFSVFTTNVDKSELSNLIVESENIDLSKYYDGDAKTNFIAKLGVAKTVDNNNIATEIEVQTAISELLSAKEKLISIPDKTELNSLVFEYMKINLSDYNDSDIKTRFITALSNASVVINNDKATVAEVVEALSALKTARELIETVKKITDNNQSQANDVISSSDVLAAINRNDNSVPIVDITKQTILSSDVFELLKRTGEGVVFKGDNYTWVFDASEITGLLNTNIDTTISFTSPNKTKIDKLCGNNEIINLYFNHHGALPGKAKITVKVDPKYANKHLFLYYYNSEKNTLELVSTKHLVQNNEISFAIDHCSDYILSDVALTNDNSSKEQDKIPNTRDENQILIIAISLLLSAIGMVFLNSKENT